MHFKEGQDLIIKQIGGGNRNFGRVDLGKGNLAIGIDKGLLVDSLVISRLQLLHFDQFRETRRSHPLWKKFE